MQVIEKAVGYFQRNGFVPTIKKIGRRLTGTGWLTPDEDALYLVRPFVVPADELWTMPSSLTPYEGTVSVVIPTYNGGEELPPLLDLLAKQESIGQIELVVVDSGSADNTVALCRAAGAKVIEITQAEFSHSYARMLGANNAAGEYLLFMTQDAQPDGTDWLLRMMQPVLTDGASAVSCFELPKPNCDLISLVTVWTWRALMSGGVDRLTKLPEDTSYDSLRRNAQLSDNACLVAKQTYMDLGGHRGAYAEDLDLGIRLLRNGKSLALLSTVGVVHSHNREPLYYFKRAIVDAVNIAGMFPDFSLDALTVQQAFNRLFTAAAANRLYLRQAADCSETEPNAFSEWTRHSYNQCIMQVKRMDKAELACLMEQSGPDMDASVRSFLLPLWSAYGKEYRFDGGLAVSQGRYIMHSLCAYLSDSHRTVNDAVHREFNRTLWQYYAQSAGYTLAAARLNPAVQDHAFSALVDGYQTGV